MELIDVSSSNIRQIGYDADTQTLGIVFNKGDLYHYNDVPEEVFEEMQRTASVGRFFHSEIRGKYDYQNMGPA